MFELTPYHIRLLPDQALLVGEKQRCLVVADLHLGKSAAFRASGLAVPEGDTARDLARLTELIKAHAPDKLVIAGDLFHAESGQTEETISAFSNFLERTAIPFTLVKGNHDAKIRNLPEELGGVEFLDLDGIRIVHKPEDASDAHFNICGHVHPLVKIPDGRNTALRLPCFHLRTRGENQGVLTIPSFGSFTGGQLVKPGKHDRFFVSHMGKVIELPQSLL
jgi:DNA ligase-associated metallophosphoesterase